MKVHADRLNRAAWERLCDKANAPLQQRWAYGETARLMGSAVCRFAVYEGRNPIALAQVLMRRLVCRTALLTRGPVWIGNVPEDQRDLSLRAMREALRKSGCSLSVLTPEQNVSLPFGCAIVTPATTATVALSETMRSSLDAKWRNRLVKAEGDGLKLRHLTKRDREHELLFNRERRQRLKRGYRNLPPAFAKAWLDDPFAHSLTLVAAESSPPAGMMFLRHGTTATYHLGWTSAEGRKRSVHTLMLWQAMEQLRTEGVRVLDLGLIDTERTPGLARFKLGAGATPHRLGSTFVVL